MRHGFDARAVVQAARTVIPLGSNPGHHEPDLGPVEFDLLRECYSTGLTGYGMIDAFEQKLAQITESKHAFATSSGTAALHLALMAVGVRPGDCVLLPSMTFVATANAIVHAGAVPVFLDSEIETFGILPHKLTVFLDREALTVEGGTWLQGRRIAAMIAVHVLGRPCRIDALRAISMNRRIPLIEDAAEAIGSTFFSRPCGSFASVATFSFNNNKTVTTGGGGAIVTSSDALDAIVRKLGTTARVKHGYEISHDAVAWNYRMPNVCAAVGLGQLTRLPQMLKSKLALAQAYEGAFSGVPGIEYARETAGARSNHWLNAITIDPRWQGGREEVMSALIRSGLGARAIFMPLHKLPMYVSAKADNPAIACDIHRRTVCLPSGAALGRRFM